MRTIAAALVTLMLALTAANAAPQRRGGRFGFRGPGVPANAPYDGAFTFCRIAFDNASNGDGAGWYVDYPRADENLSFRFSELSLTPISHHDGAGPSSFNHNVYRFTDPAIDHCPFLMMTEPGGTYFSP